MEKNKELSNFLKAVIVANGYCTEDPSDLPEDHLQDFEMSIQDYADNGNIERIFEIFEKGHEAVWETWYPVYTKYHNPKQITDLEEKVKELEADLRDAKKIIENLKGD